MGKVCVVYMCKECLHCYKDTMDDDKYKCLRSQGNKEIPDIEYIPDWCKLDDMEKYHDILHSCNPIKADDSDNCRYKANLDASLCLKTDYCKAQKRRSGMIKLRNESKYNFIDISSEKYREYVFGDETTRIDNPVYLAISDNGHRVLDAKGKCHYIPSGWIHLSWEVAEDKPHFIK